MKKKVLVVEDDADVLELLACTLRKAGEFTIWTAKDGLAGLSQARKEMPDAMLLDLMMPGMSGLEVCRILKSDPATQYIPIVMLTAKADEVDRIVGLEMGADDYVTKPFSPREVLLRVKAVMRRGEPRQPSPGMTSGPITLDRARHSVALKGREITLTTMEFKLLAALMENRGRVLSRETLLNEVWDYESACDTRTVDTHVRRLREKLGKLSQRIETIRGFGYRLRDDPADGQDQSNEGATRTFRPKPRRDAD